MRRRGGAAAYRYGVSFGGRILGALLQAAMLAFLARSFGVDEFGVYAVLSSICLFLVAVVELGTGTTVLRLPAEEDPRGVLTTVGLWRGATGIILIVGIVLFGLGLHGEQWLLYLAVAVYVSGEAVGDLSVGILQGELRSMTASIVLISRRVIAVAPFAFGLGTTTALIALVGAGLAGYAVFTVSVLARRGRPISLIRFVREKAPIILTTGARSLSQIDSVIVGAVGGFRLAGLYGAASRLSNPANIAITTFVQVMIPELATRSDDLSRLRTFRKARRIVVLVGLLTAATSVLSPWIVHFLFGDAFAEATPIVAGVLIGAGFVAVNQLHMTWFYATSVPRSVVVGTVGTVVGGLALLAVLSFFYGPWGCAAAIVAWRMASLVVLLSAWLVSTRELRARDSRGG